MSPERFEHLLSMIAPYITKKHCRSRMPISASERLCLCLRYLATGETQQSLSFSFRMGRATVSKIVKETCHAIWEGLQGKYLKVPQTAEEWQKIGSDFETEWNFPNCLGALDGKHVCMECPKNGGSAYYNYKNFHSIVLLAVCDAKYCFTLVDVGSFGRENDAAILSESAFGKLFEGGRSGLSIPSTRLVGNSRLPYVLIGDEIFPLKPWLMKPYPGRHLDEPRRVYNYRLSRARRTIENAFGILSARWRIFRVAIRANVETVELITKAAICLHNYLQLTDNAFYVPSGFVDSENADGSLSPGDWRAIVQNDESGMVSLRHVGGNRYTQDASNSRNDFKEYFNNEGAVERQYRHVRSCGVVLGNKS